MSNKNDFPYNEFKKFASVLYNMSPLEVSAIGSILGLIISAGLDFNEQNTIGNFLELVGQVILTYNAQLQTCNSTKKPQLSELQSKIDLLTLEINRLKNIHNK